MLKLIWTQLQLLECVIICLIKGVLVWMLNMNPQIFKGGGGGGGGGDCETDLILL